MWKTEKQVSHIYHKRVGKLAAAKSAAPSFPQAPTRPYYFFSFTFSGGTKLSNPRVGDETFNCHRKKKWLTSDTRGVRAPFGCGAGRDCRTQAPALGTEG